MKIKANGITINYQIDAPDGATDNVPWLVFSNSLATSLAMWDEQAAALKHSFRVLRYDQRGHGETEVPAGRYAYDTLLADALGLLDALSIRKAHFAGLSMGGATALGLAERHPERFDRIIVCDSPCQSTPQSSQQWEDRIAVAQKDGVEALVAARDGSEKSAASRQGTRDDQGDAGQRFYRLRRGACQPRLCQCRRHGEASGAVSHRGQGRRCRPDAQACRKTSRFAVF
jgi:pimeloyl-ACP methyl ester carboxylesterase